MWGDCRAFFRACARHWRETWIPGTILTADETMVSWTGPAGANLTYMARKPHPQGFQIKTLACSESKIVVAIDLVEGAEQDAGKSYNQEWGKSTGCTLRLTEPYHGTGRTVVADSWFGSVNTAVALLKHGLYFVGNVKNGHYGYPKAWVKSLCTERGDKVFAKKTWPLVNTRCAAEQPATVERRTVYLAGHCDKAPTCVVATRGTSKPGKPANRVFRQWVNGKVVARRYDLEQPHMLELYRSNFNAIDVANRMS